MKRAPTALYWCGDVVIDRQFDQLEKVLVCVNVVTIRHRGRATRSIDHNTHGHHLHQDQAKVREGQISFLFCDDFDFVLPRRWPSGRRPLWRQSCCSWSRRRRRWAPSLFFRGIQDRLAPRAGLVLDSPFTARAKQTQSAGSCVRVSTARPQASALSPG